MKIMNNIVNKIGTDKIIHFLLSGWLTLFVFMFNQKIISAAMIVLVIGIVKEALDMKDTGFNIYDLFANILGIAVSVIFIIILGVR